METVTPEAQVNYSNGRFNRAAIKRQLKKVSEVTRGSKFTRVSDAALNDMEAIAEAKIRELMDTTHPSPIGGVVLPGDEKFLTGEGERRLIEAFNKFMAAKMQRHVNLTRVGSTL